MTGPETPVSEPPIGPEQWRPVTGTLEDAYEREILKRIPVRATRILLLGCGAGGLETAITRRQSATVIVTDL